jgi:Xaa-Pro aminopeptidase
VVATPETPESYKIENGMALAWNPSLPGAKIEDTVLATERGIEILTVDPQWPTFEFMNRARPDVWIRK